jgi:hypothetical protein
MRVIRDLDRKIVEKIEKELWHIGF